MKRAKFAGLLTLFVTSLPVMAIDLLGAYRNALENDPVLQASRSSTEAAREALPQARAGLLPNIGLSGSRSRNSTEQTAPGTDREPLNYDYTAKGYSLSLRQPLVRFASYFQYEQSQSQVAAAEAALENELQQLAVRVSSTYFDVLAAQETLVAVRAQIQATSGQLTSAEKAFAQGAGTRTDIEEAKARRDLAVAQEIQARNALAVYERALAAILGRRLPATELAAIDRKRLRLVAPEPQNIEHWLDEAAANNRELVGLRHQLEAAESEIRKQRSGHLPTVDMVVSRSLSASENNYSVGSQYLTNSIGVQVNIPLFAGGAQESMVRQAFANRDRVRYNLESARRQSEVSVMREFSGVVEGMARIEALEQALHSAEQALAATEKGLQAGTRNRVDVLNAQQQVFSTRLELVRARNTYAISQIRLRTVTGVLTEADIVRVNAWLAPQ